MRASARLGAVFLVQRRWVCKVRLSRCVIFSVQYCCKYALPRFEPIEARPRRGNCRIVGREVAQCILPSSCLPVAQTGPFDVAKRINGALTGEIWADSRRCAMLSTCHGDCLCRRPCMLEVGVSRLPAAGPFAGVTPKSHPIDI